MTYSACKNCRMRDELEQARANTIRGLMRRLGRAVIALFQKPQLPPPVKNPRFWCHVCKRFVDPKNVTANPPWADFTRSGAVNEGFLGFEFNVTCHGETKPHYLTLVAALVGSSCHLDAFEPERSPTQWLGETEEMAQKRLAKVAAHEKRLQKEIARANEQRERFVKESEVLARLHELMSLVRGMGIVLPEYEAPGVITEPASDRIQTEAKHATRVNPTTEAPGI